MSRWHGTVPPGHLFWTDMIVHGTAINVVAALIGSFLFVLDAPTALAVTFYFLPLPYNVFLFAALLRSAAGIDEPRASAWRAGGLLWFILVTIV